jgi:hypothetical protein
MVDGKQLELAELPPILWQTMAQRAGPSIGEQAAKRAEV